ncbi:hypothetical protein QTP70_003561 [Hemibagrus guttatus]|uniref:Integrase catalytic domain-containing protein n=1 Tax=Hemibagrus guttatus TaxID=175788 RepID=A0AAE0VAV9_9TELE|nr:hypothetical protein QTP70_003561 [Hemibagrus guttatus]
MCLAVFLAPPMCLTVLLAPPMCLAMFLASPMCLAIFLAPPTCHAVLFAPPWFLPDPRPFRTFVHGLAGRSTLYSRLGLPGPGLTCRDCFLECSICESRWALCFTRFQFTDMYCLGMKSGKTDALSWQHDPTSAPAQPKPILPPSACSDLVGPQGGDTVGQVNVSLSSEYHPQFNGQTERLNQEIGRYLQCWTTSFPWSGEPSDVPVVDDWIRHSREVWESAHIHLQRAIQRQQIQADRQRCPHPRFQLPPLYRISPTFNVSLPKLAHPHQDDATIRDEPPPPLDIDRVPAYRKDTELLVPGALAASFSATTEGTLPVEVSKAKQKAYDELYTRLDTREGEKDLYRLARQRDRDGKDVQQVRVIKDRDGRVLTSEESVQRRWKEYFEELMNEENEREKRVEGVNSVEQKVDKMRKDEVRKTLKRMKSGKAVGPDDIPVEVWKCLGEAAVEFLTSLFNRVLKSERMPEEWR